MKIVADGQCRGTFGRADFPVAKGDSIIKVKGLNLPDDGVFVSGTTTEKVEKKGIIQCFNNVNHIYAFGQDPENSRYSCTLKVFMQKPGCSEQFESGQAVANLISEYKRLRVSKNPAIVRMQIDDGSFLCGILVGLSVAVEDATINLLSMTFSFTDLDAEG